MRFDLVLWWAWMLPVALPMWVFYVLPCWAIGWWKLENTRGGIFYFKMVAKNNWYARAWQRWAGFSGPGCVVLNTSIMSERVRKHEERHCKQWFTLGIFFPIVYGLLLLGFGYRQNPMEVDAREAENH